MERRGKTGLGLGVCVTAKEREECEAMHVSARGPPPKVRHLYRGNGYRRE